MADRFPDAPWLQDPSLQKVLAALGAPQTDVRAVGGCVRDTVLERDVTDIDLATPDLPDVTIEKLEAAGLKAAPTGIEHGTVTAVAGGQGFEITTLRKDTACDGRHASVEFTADWQEDAARRDFTFNAMSMTPAGEIFDFFGGVEDAKAGRVNFVGAPADRIQEDYLRILRLFRFLAHYGRCDPDAATLDACRTFASHISGLSADRVRNEMVKLLSAPDPRRAVVLMSETGVLDAVFSGRTDIGSLARLIDLEHRVAESGPADDQDRWHRRWCAVLPEHDEEISHRFHMSKRDAKVLKDLMIAADACPVGKDEAAWRSFFYAHYKVAADAVLIAAARLSECDPDEAGENYASARTWRQPVFPLTGRDLQDVGFAPGTVLGRALDGLERQWVESGFALSRDDLLRAANDLKP